MKQYVIIKGMLHSDQLIENMVTIGIDIYLSNNALFEYRCLENINKLYNTAGKCNDQQKYKTTIETALVSKPKGCNYNSPITPNDTNTSQSFFSSKNKCAHKYLETFSKTLDVETKTYVQRICFAKAKRLAIKVVN